jgi:hypothetical protein
MAGVAPGSNSRGRGNKFRKFTRGGVYAPLLRGKGRPSKGLTDLVLAGGKHYSRNLRPLDADGNEISMWSEDANKRPKGSDEGDDGAEDEDEDDEGSDEDSDEGGPSSGAAVTREDHKREKAARKAAAIAKAKAQTIKVGDLPSSESEEESDGDAPANPNHSRAARSQANVASPVEEAAAGVKALSVGGTPNRRERESLQALQAKEKYRKLHEQGKTDEAKADLARLKLIREKREAEAARKQVSVSPRSRSERAS